MKILIAEDEQRARRGLRALITSISEEFDVVAEAADGKQALELMQAIKPDIVFTDLKMPYMDGMALIRAAKAAGISSQYVIVSAYEDFEVARQAISLGVKEYLVKPITYDEVEKLLERLVQDEREMDESRTANLKERYPDVHPLVRKALGFIESGYSSKISQKELAENLGISQEYLCYLFNRDMGDTFSHVLKEFRIEAAKGLLKNGETPKEEVPYSVGFSDSKYFNKVFREVTGESVAEFCKKHKR